MAETKISQVQANTSYMTAPAQRVLERCQYAAAGGWVAYGCNPTGQWDGEIPYFKPLTPPLDFKNGKLKPRKYPNPAGAPALPIQPWVDDDTAQAIYTRYSVAPESGETFWGVVWRCNLPIAVTEGFKKALSLIAHGMPAIAIRGITQWHQKGTRELHDAIAHFATAKRTVYVVMDMETETRKQINVRRETLKLSLELVELDCLVRIPLWDPALGKGVDDALCHLGESAQDWFDALMDTAPTLTDYKRGNRLAAAIAAINRLNHLSCPVERATTDADSADGYMPELPELAPGKIHVIDANMNSGKTFRIGKDYVTVAKANGWFTLVLSPLNSLGQQTANAWGLPHIHNLGASPDEQKALWAMASQSGGIVCCPDSLHRIPDWVWSRPVMLVLDEANQVIHHTTQGDTIALRYANILQRFTQAARHAFATGAIVLAEAGVPDRAVKFIQTICAAEDTDIRVFTHQRHNQPWRCQLFTSSVSGFRHQFLRAIDAAEADEKFLFVTSSQKEARRLDLILNDQFSDLTVVRIDGLTNEQGRFTRFFENPDAWLQEHKPDVLILSPSAKSGVSIEGNVALEDAYFSAVWAYFPVLATDTHLQLLGRYRPSVPRFIFTPDFILASGDESLLKPKAITRRLSDNAKAIAGLYNLGSDPDEGRDELVRTTESAVLAYLAEAKAVSGNQKLIAQESLVYQLAQAGHNITLAKVSKDKAAADLWKKANRTIWWEDALAIAQSQIDPDIHTQEWAYNTLNSIDASRESRIKAQKVLLRIEFPGIDFDDPQLCFEALTNNNGKLRSGVLMQIKAESPDAALEMDRSAATAILNGDLRPLHRLPKNYSKALLISLSGVLDLLDQASYSNASAIAKGVKDFALKYADEFRYWLGFNIDATQTPIAICHKLLKRLGLVCERKDRPGAIKCVARPGERNQQRDRIYCIDMAYSEIHTQLLNAARHKVSGMVSRENKEDRSYLLKIADPGPEPPGASPVPPPNSAELQAWFDPAALEDVRQMFEAAIDPQTKAELIQLVPEPVLKHLGLVA